MEMGRHTALFEGQLSREQENMRYILRAFIVLFAISIWPESHAVAQSHPKRIVVLGDSLAAGYGLAEDAAYPSRLQAALTALGREVVLVNAGVSGDTASGGLARLDWAVGDGVHGVIVELGANDMLRGIAPEQTEKALDAILRKLQDRGIPSMLAGMVAAPGMGKEYESRFNEIYSRLAEKYGAVFYPFFLDGVAGQKELLLADGMHPNRRGVDEMVRRSLPKVIEFLDRIERK